MYYDAHTHLNSDILYPQRQQHCQDFFDAGGKGLVNIGVNHERNLRGITIARQSPLILGAHSSHLNETETIEKENKSKNQMVTATIGLHPGEISSGTITNKKQINTEIHQLQQLYKQNSAYIVGIGECGIDSHYERNEDIQALQMYAFDQQCQMADRLNLPIIIHSRDNFSLTREIIKNYPELKIYFHCRGYGPDELQQLYKHLPKLRIGFCGNLSYPKAQILRGSFDDILKQSNLNKTNKQFDQTSGVFVGPNFLLETDAPYLTSQKKRGQINLPHYIIDLYDYIHDQRNIPQDTLQQYLQTSFQKLYY